MKHTFTAFAAMIVLTVGASGQILQRPYCAHTEPDTITFMAKGPSATQPTFNQNLSRGGLAIPAQTWDREFRVLIIYIRFPDDTVTTPA